MYRHRMSFRALIYTSVALLVLAPLILFTVSQISAFFIPAGTYRPDDHPEWNNNSRPMISGLYNKDKIPEGVSPVLSSPGDATAIMGINTAGTVRA